MVRPRPRPRFWPRPRPILERPPGVPLCPRASEKAGAQPWEQGAIVVTLRDVRVAWQHLLKRLRSRGEGTVNEEFSQKQSGSLHLWCCENGICPVTKMDTYEGSILRDCLCEHLSTKPIWTRFPTLWTLILTHRDDLLGGDGKHEGIANEGQWDRARQVVEVAVSRVPQQVGNGCLPKRTNFVQWQLNWEVLNENMSILSEIKLMIKTNTKRRI